MRWRNLVATGVLFALSVSSARAFEYFEHRWVGDLVCQQLVGEKLVGETKQPGQERRWPGDSCVITPGLRGDARLTFGDLVAMVDHFATPDELAQAIQQYSAGVNPDARVRAIVRVREFNLRRVRAWLGRQHLRDRECKTADWIMADDCRECVQKDPAECVKKLTSLVAGQGSDPVQVPESDSAQVTGFETAQITAGECYEPSEYEWAGWVGLPGFISLARVARAHFGAEAIDQADTALKQAFPGKRGSPPDAKGDPYYRKMSLLAFAAHYFMDRFSAGHIRTEILKLTSAEAQRVHDYDCAEGLTVTYFPRKALGPESKVPMSSVTRLHAVGDRCLLSIGGTATRSLVVLALAQAIREAQDNDGQGLAGKRDQWFPALTHQNQPVPPPPGYARIVAGSGVGFSASRPRPFREAQPGMSAMLHLEILAPVDFLPAESLQLAYFGADGSQIFVPIAAQTSDALAWMYGLAAYPFTDDDGRSAIWRFRESHRNAFQWNVGKIANLAIMYPFVGWAITRAPSEYVTNSAVGILPVKLSVFDRFSLFVHGSLATRNFHSYTPLVGVHLGIEI